MPFALEAEAPPIREDVDGALRVGESRVLLELVVQAFQDGAAAEAIVLRYPSLTLGDTYAVIGYYLRHKADVEQYLERREARGAEVRAMLDRQQRDISDLRARLNARRQP